MVQLRIRALRKDGGLKQIDVAQGTGIDQKTLSNYETGKTLPDAESLIRLADFFKVSIDYLVGRTDMKIYSDESVNERLQNIKTEIDAILKPDAQACVPSTYLSKNID